MSQAEWNACFMKIWREHKHPAGILTADPLRCSACRVSGCVAIKLQQSDDFVWKESLRVAYKCKVVLPHRRAAEHLDTLQKGNKSLTSKTPNCVEAARPCSDAHFQSQPGPAESHREENWFNVS